VESSLTSPATPSKHQPDALPIILTGSSIAGVLVICCVGICVVAYCKSTKGETGTGSKSRSMGPTFTEHSATERDEESGVESKHKHESRSTEKIRQSGKSENLMEERVANVTSGQADFRISFEQETKSTQSVPTLPPVHDRTSAQGQPDSQPEQNKSYRVTTFGAQQIKELVGSKLLIESSELRDKNLGEGNLARVTFGQKDLLAMLNDKQQPLSLDPDQANLELFQKLSLILEIQQLTGMLSHGEDKLHYINENHQESHSFENLPQLIMLEEPTEVLQPLEKPKGPSRKNRTPIEFARKTLTKAADLTGLITKFESFARKK